MPCRRQALHSVRVAGGFVATMTGRVTHGRLLRKLTFHAFQKDLAAARGNAQCISGNGKLQGVSDSYQSVGSNAPNTAQFCLT
jgi:hypothetical protein